MKIAHVGRRETFPLGTPSEAAAAAKARDITLRRYKSSSVTPNKLGHSESTVGDFVAELKEKSDLKPKALEGYSTALRKIVAGVIAKGRSKEARSLTASS